MQISRQVVVTNPVTTVRPAGQDASFVALLSSGVQFDTVDVDGIHMDTVDVRLGRTPVSFGGEAPKVGQDQAERRLVIAASGTERRGRGGVNTITTATVAVRDETSTALDVEANIDLNGPAAVPAAQLSSRGETSEDQLDELIGPFVDNLKPATDQWRREHGRREQLGRNGLRGDDCGRDRRNHRSDEPRPRHRVGGTPSRAGGGSRPSLGPDRTGRSRGSDDAHHHATHSAGRQ